MISTFTRLAATLLALGTMPLAAASQAADKSAQPQPRTEETVPLALVLPKPEIIGTPRDIKSTHLEPERTGPRPAMRVPKGLVNLALKQPVTSSDKSPCNGDLEMITDGDKTASCGSFVEFGPGTQWVQVDLGAPSEIFAVVLWHYHNEARIYADVVVQIADDKDFTTRVRTIFNNDDDNSSGLGVGKDYEYIDSYEGRLIEANGQTGRFVRCSSRGSTSNDLNHYVELEVWGRKR